MYDIIGYFVSASILYGLFSLIFKVSDCLASKIENFFDDLKAKKKTKKDEIEKKIPKKSNDEMEVLINRLLKNEANRKSIDKLISKINLLKQSEIIETLTMFPTDELNKLKHLLSKNHKNKEPFLKSNIFYVIVGAVFGEATKGIVNGTIIDKLVQKEPIYIVASIFILVVSFFIYVVIKLYNNSKIIELDSEYLISEIDLIIEERKEKQINENKS